MSVTVTPINFKPNTQSPFTWTSKNINEPLVRMNSFGLPYRAPQPVDAPGQPLNRFQQSEIIQVLQSQWGFNNGDDVRRTCEVLLHDGMHYRMYDAMLEPAFALAKLRATNPSPLEFRSQVDLYTDFLRTIYAAQATDPTPWVEQFHHWVNLLVTPGFHEITPSRTPHSTRAWDLMRIELTAGRAVGCGWISPEEGQDYSRRAVQELQRSFANWQQVALSFWWGRAIWQADEPFDLQRVRYYDDLFSTALTHPDSPWVRVPLHPFSA